MRMQFNIIINYFLFAGISPYPTQITAIITSEDCEDNKNSVASPICLFYAHPHLKSSLLLLILGRLVQRIKVLVANHLLVTRWTYILRN